MEESLKRLLKNSYSPYSGFRVASICLMKDGKSFGGVNVENASYGATICAERVAITSAIASGYTKGDFSKLYVMCDSSRIASSCFICRQVINEFFDKDCEVILYSNDGEKEIYTVRELCPYPFGSSDLN
ncbi:MAG: cytidine deaminase [Bacilli bacterium]|mgnify:FL=1|jgi:cytidine deaminase|nr:cytidine deaminase [Bacilli bacterium]MDY5995858.1 cytidine deaminase [Bacilli bacterium]MEE1370869.1 cytidine deaminase [Bacilli bacterium]